MLTFRLGSVDVGHVTDLYFRSRDHRVGPFRTIKEFNDSLQKGAFHVLDKPPSLEPLPDPYREYLSDSGGICFTHRDFNLRNAMGSEEGPLGIVAVVDWEQAGWYPEYWEYAKLLVAEIHSDEWRWDGWVDRVIQVYENERFVVGEYWGWRCP